MKVDISILTTLEEEQDAVLDQLDRLKGSGKEVTKGSSGRTYALFSIPTTTNNPCIVSLCRGPEQGNDVSQQVVTDIISDLDPQLLLVVGIAGGVPSQDFTLGDVIISSRIHNFNVNALNQQDSTYDLKGGIHPFVSDLVASLLLYKDKLAGWNEEASIGMARPSVDLANTPLGLYGDSEWLQDVLTSLETHFGKPASDVRQPLFKIGSIASSNSLIKNTNVLTGWLKSVRSILAVEMESAGAFQAGQQIVKQYPVMAIRGISDIIGMKRDDRWKFYACQTAGAFACAFIQAGIIKPDPKRIRSPLGELPAFEPPVGRDNLLLQLKQQLKDPNANSRTYILHGLPGVGKTTIAVQLARDQEILAAFSGAVLWANLGEDQSLDDSLAIWESQLNADLSRAITIPQKFGCIQEKLGHAPFLLIIDGLWIDNVKALSPLFGMVRGNSDCGLLITTRWRNVLDALDYNITNKQVLVEEVDDKAALTILRKICQNTVSDQEALASLARASGGLPMTLEIIGKHINRCLSLAYDPGDLQQELLRIENYLRLPEVPGDLGIGLQKLQRAINLSANNLPKRKTKKVFYALGAFAPKPATFSETAARYVSRGQEEDLRILSDASLLQSSSKGRFMLHQSLTDVARTHLSTRNPAWYRHRIYYYKQIENMVLITNGKTNTLINVDWPSLFSDLPQIRAIRIPRRLAALFSIIVNRLSVSRKWLAWLNRLPDWLKYLLSLMLLVGLSLLSGLTHLTKQVHLEATLANYRGWLCAETGDRVHALIHYKYARELWMNVDIDNDHLGLAQVFNNLGKTYYMMAEYQLAIDAYDHALAIYREQNELGQQARTLTNMGTTLDMIGNVDRAIECFLLALDLYKQVQGEEIRDERKKAEDERGKALALHHLGVAYQGLGKKEKALSCLEEALNKHIKNNDKVGRSRTLMEFGAVYLDIDSLDGSEQKQNSLRTATEYFQQALELQKDFDDFAWQGRTLSRIGQVYAKQGETAKALEVCLQALFIHQNVNYHAGLSTTLDLISSLFREAGKDM